MPIRDLIEQVAAVWPAYRQKKTVDKTDPVYDLVTTQFPAALQPYVEAFSSIGLEGSTGRGNITAAPWIALFDQRITTSATEEYYVVYLFSTDMSAVTLTLAFGTTQFEKQFGGPSDAFPRMRFAAGRLQEMFNHIILPQLSRGPIDLVAEPRQKLHYAYQQSAILSYPPYNLGALPEENQLVSDLKGLVQVYSDIVSDPLAPSVDHLVEAVVDPAPVVQLPEMREFEPRPPLKPGNSNSSAGQRRRYSPVSRKVGDAGERAVVAYEIDRLLKLGRSDLADRVRSHAEEREFLGWDITSFDADETELFIEVKSSVGKTISTVDLTVNEWQAACHPLRRERYYIYLVTNALSAKPIIERLRNPFSYADSGKLSCEPIVYEFDLRQRQ